MIDYEKLVSDPEGESPRLIEFLGLEWEPACLDFHRTQRPVLTASACRKCGSRSTPIRLGAGGATSGSEAIAECVVGKDSLGVAIQPRHPSAVGFSYVDLVNDRIVLVST